MSKIHVIIPVYNAKKFLREAVDSVLNQPYKGIDIVLVNDGSTDGSAELCDEIAANKERVSVIHQENGGVSRARNTGIEYALAHSTDEDYIAFLDADDLWVEKVVDHNLILSLQNIDIFLFLLYYANSTISNARLSSSNLSGLISHPASCSLWDIPMSAAHTFFKVSLIRRAHLHFSEGVSFGEDACFMRYAAYHARNIFASDIVLMYYRTNSASLSHTFVKQKITPWLQQIHGFLSGLEEYAIADPKFRHCILDYCCWLYLEMSESYYLHLQVGNEPYDVLESHPIQEYFCQNCTQLSEREKERIGFMLNHHFLFKCKFLVKGIVHHSIKLLLQLPFINSWYEKILYPIAIEKTKL